MIIEAILNAMFAVILGVVNLFPTLPKIEITFLDGIFQVFSLVDTFVSLKTVSYCLVTVFFFMNIEVVWSVIMWVVRKIPSIN